MNRKGNIVIFGVAAILIVAALFFLGKYAWPLVIGVSADTLYLPSSFSIEVNDETQVDRAVLLGSFAFDVGNPEIGCVPYRTGISKTDLCRQSGYRDVYILGAPCGSGQIACFRDVRINTRDVQVYIAGRLVYQQLGEASGSFTTVDFSDAINSYCEAEFTALAECKAGIRECTGDYECVVPGRAEGTGSITNFRISADSGIRIVTPTTTTMPFYPPATLSPSTTIPGATTTIQPGLVIEEGIFERFLGWLKGLFGEVSLT